jgi:TolA-binding protein
MNVELLLAVNAFLTLVLGIALRAVASIYQQRFKSLESAKDDHEKRIQRSEDVQSLKIDDLSKKVSLMEVEMKHEFEQMKQQVGTLSQNLHKQKNEESALVFATNGLLKFLERHEKGSN